MASNDKTFYEIGLEAMNSMIEALDAGRPLTSREVEVPDAPKSLSGDEIAHIRTDQFGVSQDVFARLLNVATKTVQAWEQGRNSPTGATLRLIRIAQEDPRILLKDIRVSRPRATRGRSKPHFSQGSRGATRSSRVRN
ncbi:MAG TPA: helix-turn-helix domain-containing protein [Phycisphaerae bacterium]|nr:helix-turn-helix domain-containing protein [Phycisphaerae bacterium]HQL71917.1 helix-turn-helix domain-containing protein [Phycisphaerae bacterium]